MCKRAFIRLLIIRRLKFMGTSQTDLLDVYEKQVRCVVEFAVAAWNSSLTKYEVTQIERVQKAALAILLGDKYMNYENALSLTGLKCLSVRREDLCLIFAKKASNNPKYGYWFSENLHAPNTRQNKDKLEPVQYRTDRFRKSPISYLTHLLNNERK